MFWGGLEKGVRGVHRGRVLRQSVSLQDRAPNPAGPRRGGPAGSSIGHNFANFGPHRSSTAPGESKCVEGDGKSQRVRQRLDLDDVERVVEPGKAAESG